jgi:hypothetical protein
MNGSGFDIFNLLKKHLLVSSLHTQVLLLMVVKISLQAGSL